MSRKLGLGEAGEATVVRQRLEDGKWRSVESGRADRWRARIGYRDMDGLTKEITAFAEKKNDAVKICEANLAKRLQGRPDGVKADSLFVDVGYAWIEHIKRPKSGKSERTIVDYESSFKRHVDVKGSPIRGLTLKQVDDPQTIRLFLEGVADDRGTQSARMLKSVVSGIIGFGIDNGVLKTNASRMVRPPTSRNPKRSARDHMRAMTRGESDTVLAYAKKAAEEPGLNPRTVRKRETTHDLVAFMADSGARISEARHVEWADVDLVGGTVLIRGTKSDSSERTVQLTNWQVGLLKARRERTGGEGYVFSAPAHTDSGKVWEQSNCASSVRALFDDAGFSWAIPHTLRRTMATTLLESGRPANSVRDRMGHKDAALTLSAYFARPTDDGHDVANAQVLER